MVIFPKEAGIYKLTCSINGKIYVGKSVNLKTRLRMYKNCGGKSKGRYLIEHAIIKYGWDQFVVEILETIKDFDKNEDNQSLLKREAYYIELFDSTNKDKGYNICKFSTDRTGISHSEESKEKMRKPRTEKHKENLRRSRVGRTLSKEHKENLRLANLGNNHALGKKHSEECIQARLGRKLSEETKEKIRQAKQGRKLSEETKEKIRRSRLGKKYKK